MFPQHINTCTNCIHTHTHSHTHTHTKKTRQPQCLPCCGCWWQHHAEGTHHRTPKHSHWPLPSAAAWQHPRCLGYKPRGAVSSLKWVERSKVSSSLGRSGTLLGAESRWRPLLPPLQLGPTEHLLAHFPGSLSLWKLLQTLGDTFSSVVPRWPCKADEMLKSENCQTNFGAHFETERSFLSRLPDLLLIKLHHSSSTLRST